MYPMYNYSFLYESAIFRSCSTACAWPLAKENLAVYVFC